MDQPTFDRLTRLVAASGSRRAAWRALLAAALFRATTRPAAASLCANGKHTCGEACCPGKCFALQGEACPLCCTGTNIICKDPVMGKSTCCLNDGSEDPCAKCGLPENPNPLCRTGITGTYRRR
jgi:hypothetical protein